MGWISNIVEIVYFITAGPILTIVVILGLKQIKVTREIARNATERESYKLAAEQCHYFAEKILPLYEELQKEMKQKDIKFFTKFEVEITSNKIRCRLIEEVSKKDIHYLNNSSLIADLLNRLEAYSLYFASGIAVERVGFNVTGKAYCGIVREFIPFLVQNFKDNYYPNISKVFLLWHKRCEVEKLELQKKDIEKKLGQNQFIEISPMGL